MPKSKVRKKPSITADTISGSPAISKSTAPSPTWYPIAMCVLLIIGLAYIVVYYMAAESIPFMNSLGSWNFAVGFGFLVVGLGMAVRWR